jgi:CRP-like cAMP-binding protein
LIGERSSHDYIYRLREGWAGRSRLLEDGRNQFILIFLPGDLFAVKSMFVSRHVDSVRALSPLVADRIHFRILHDLFDRDGDVAARCLWQVMEEERRLHSWVVGLGQGSAEERMALLLLDRRLVSQEAMHEIVQVALASKRQMIWEREHPRISQVAAGLLCGLENSLAARKQKFNLR